MSRDHPRRRPWRPLTGRLWFSGRHRLTRPGEWAWPGRRRRKGRKNGREEVPE